MNKKFGFRMAVIGVFLATALILGIVSSGYSNECGPTLGRLTGRPLHGLFSSALVKPTEGDPFAVSYLRVECRDGTYLDFGPFVEDLVIAASWGTYVQQNLEDLCLPGIQALQSCGAASGIGDWAVSRVNQWIKTDVTMSAEVVLQEEVVP